MNAQCPKCGSKKLTRLVKETILTTYDWNWENEGKGRVETQETYLVRCKVCGSEFEPPQED